MADEIDVDIWADIVCPWCAIGCTQLLTAVEELRGELDVTVRFMPFELNPDMGPEGHEQIDLLAKAYEKSPAEVMRMRRDVEAAGEAAGFEMTYRGEGIEPVLMVWNTHDAHKLLRWALSVDSPAAQVRLAQALFRAQFQQRRNISDRDVLADIAAAEGFDRTAAAEALADEALSTAIRMEERRALENRINSVPTAVVAGKYILQGAAPPEKFRQALVQIAQMEAAA
jgi:predicted DsbA family dithiol-disulfide isomerase